MANFLPVNLSHIRHHPRPYPTAPSAAVLHTPVFSYLNIQTRQRKRTTTLRRGVIVRFAFWTGRGGEGEGCTRERRNFLLSSILFCLLVPFLCWAVFVASCHPMSSAAALSLAIAANAPPPCVCLCVCVEEAPHIHSQHTCMIDTHTHTCNLMEW